MTNLVGFMFHNTHMMVKRQRAGIDHLRVDGCCCGSNKERHAQSKPILVHSKPKGILLLLTADCVCSFALTGAQASQRDNLIV